MKQSDRFWRARAVRGVVGGVDSGGSDSGGSDSGGSDSGGSDSGSSDSGSSGAGATQAVATPGVPMGLSPTRPTVLEPIRGDGWPPADVDPDASPTNAPHVLGKQFEDVSWSDYYAAIACLGQFVAEKSGAGGWNTISLTKWNDANTPAELKELHSIAEYRPALMAEALAQKSQLVLYWQTMLAFNSSSHPATTRLMEVCLRVAQLAVMYYKRKFHRPRPSQLSPWLMPPVAVPGHASFPSGHATESRLQALCLIDALPPGTLYNDTDSGSIGRLADRIARNREVLGLHYPSDSVAGQQLAEELFVMLQGTSSIEALMVAARAEWLVVVGTAATWPP